MKWQPIETMPRDGRTVELLSPAEGVDTGEWYYFDEPGWAEKNTWWQPLEGMNDTSGDFNTRKGSGDYTHWRDIEDTQP
jgi:hypothetical protein